MVPLDHLVALSASLERCLDEQARGRIDLKPRSWANVEQARAISEPPPFPPIPRNRAERRAAKARARRAKDDNE